MGSIETFLPGLAAGSNAVNTGSAAAEGVYGIVTGSLGNIAGSL